MIGPLFDFIAAYKLKIAITYVCTCDEAIFLRYKSFLLYSCMHDGRNKPLATIKYYVAVAGVIELSGDIP